MLFVSEFLFVYVYSVAMNDYCMYLICEFTMLTKNVTVTLLAESTQKYPLPNVGFITRYFSCVFVSPCVVSVIVTACSLCLTAQSHVCDISYELLSCI